MERAIVAFIVAIIAIAVIALFLYMMYRRRSSENIISESDVEHIRTYGIGTPKIKRKGAHAKAFDSNDVKVKTTKESLSLPSEMISRRFSLLGVFIAAVFSILGLKVWSMQVLGKETYSDEAEDNLYANVTTPAPRGWIYDKTGIALVKNRISRTVLAESYVTEDIDVVRRLSAVLGIPAGVIRQRIKDKSAGAQNQSIVASDVRLRDIAFISEHADAFPGVTVEDRTVRDYPYGALASHALGYTGSPTEEELSVERNGRVIESSDTIGKSGIESFYDDILSGEKGTRKLVVDASGNVVNVISEIEPSKGSDAYLTLDANVQYKADKLLAQTIAPGGDIGSGSGVSACVVGMNLKTGGIEVMSSYPTFDPTNFSDGIPQDIWELYNSDESHAPLMNRAINGQYAPASTFKAFTSMAGLYHGLADTSSWWVCSGSWDGFGSGDVQNCWQLSGHGGLDLHGGIVNSCDVVYYEIAKAFYDHGPEGTGELSETALQEYLYKFNFGKQTGIDLEGESVGVVPTPEWKAEQWKNVPSEAFWRGGDYTNMIIGQGDVLVTPMQLVCGYCGIATGRILKPHLLSEVKNGSGETVLKVEPEVLTELDLDDSDLDYVRDALHDMLSSNETLQQRFLDNGLDAACKSGTAEHSGKKDDAWFAAYAPFDDPQYAVVCLVEQGGGGADTAGPIVAEVLGALCSGGSSEHTDNNSRSESDTDEDSEMGSDSISYISGSSGVSTVLDYSDSSGRQD